MEHGGGLWYVGGGAESPATSPRGSGLNDGKRFVHRAQTNLAYSSGGAPLPPGNPEYCTTTMFRRHHFQCIQGRVLLLMWRST
jgi:hypothetical protein